MMMYIPPRIEVYLFAVNNNGEKLVIVIALISLFDNQTNYLYNNAEIRFVNRLHVINYKNGQKRTKILKLDISMIVFCIRANIVGFGRYLFFMVFFHQIIAQANN
jgi:hypothetical protein